jgi:predicted GNAT family acetyltransferase
MTKILDNPVWNALKSGNQALALGTGSVSFFPSDIAPFVGLEKNTPENLQALYEITPEDDTYYAVVTPGIIKIPSSWKVADKLNLKQMICEKANAPVAASEPVISLSKEHITQMLELTKLTNPGPFRQRTIDFGHYEGIFDGDRLIAMAGQRMHVTPYAEISAVCTDPNYVGRGYASALIQRQIRRMNESGQSPILHVATSNDRAIRLYRSLGFVIRKDMFVYIIKK